MDDKKVSKKAAKKVASKPKAKRHCIAKGRSLCCGSRGCVMKSGEIVTERDLHNDPDASKDAFKAHLELGTIVECD